MKQATSPNKVTERTVIVLLLVLLPLLPPLLELWADAGGWWFTPYMIWGGMIIAAYLLQRFVNRNAV